MAYYTRLFSRQIVTPSITEWESLLREYEARLGLTQQARLVFPGSPSGEEFDVMAGETRVFSLSVDHHEVLHEEIEEFVDFLEGAKPERNAIWVSDYLRSSRTVIAFEIGRDAPNAYAGLDAHMRLRIRQQISGINQSDSLKFTNESGDLVLSDGPPNGDGETRMALLDTTGEWQRFSIRNDDELGYLSFLDGKVPTGAHGVRKI